jgi:hypothetical protein
MPFVDSIEQALLNHFFNDGAYTPDATMFLALSSTTPTDAGGNFTEPTTGGYARIAIGATEMGAAGGTAPAEKSNTSALTFATASADWDNSPVTHFGVCSADVEGVADVLAWGALAVSKDVNNGDTASFAIGALDFRLGKGTPG